ncbi:nitroreductase family protein [Hyphococcus sp.]|uniref:nitroreductase family protein n=1 Tax=Hyphococcus sp. TaxID=2038636 RepID=UPI0035C77303
MADRHNYPELGDILPSSYPSEATLEMLRRRRSCPADFLTGPGPDAAQLEDILTIAARVPDHRRVVPFRFVVFEGDARARFGAVLKKAFLKNEPEADDAKAAYEENRFLRAPVVIAVISKTDPSHRTPEWEQILCAGAVCQNMLLAASAHGFAAQWLTEWYAYDEAVLGALGLAMGEKIAGYVYIGTAKEDPKERGRPDMPSIVSRWGE